MNKQSVALPPRSLLCCKPMASPGLPMRKAASLGWRPSRPCCARAGRLLR